MILESIMGRLANSAGIEDRLLVRLDVLSVYLLQHLHETGILNHMCFKGGISLRKVFSRKPSRFSRDVDFVDASYERISDKGITPEEYYYKLLDAFDDRIIHDVHWKVKSLTAEELNDTTLRVDLYFFIYDDHPAAGWENRTDNILSVECSFRRPILLPKQQRPLREESWFKHLEFAPSRVPVFQTEEATAEKIRAAFQRSNLRDVFDLHQYGQIPFDEELVRIMAILKCWQDRGLYRGQRNFDPQEFIDKLKVENYPWERLKSQVSPSAWVEPAKLIKELRKRFAFLQKITQGELELCDDRAQMKTVLHDQLWELCKKRYEQNLLKAK